MRWAKFGYVGGAVLSVGVHVFAFTGLSAIKRTSLGTQHVAVMMSSAKKQKPKPPEPPKPIEAPKEMLQRPLAPAKAAPPPVAPPPPDPIAAAHPALAAMPDFGISLSGGQGGPGGIAVPMGGPRPAVEPVAHKEKTFGAAAERTAVSADDCAEDLVKAKPGAFVQATYTDDARAAGIEGRVRVQVTIDASGAITDAKVVSGLGHGLDESTVAAARRMNFSAATRCGKPVQSTFVLSMRFALGE